MERTFALSDHPHRRYNPLLGEWVLVSPHRAKRPWQGQTEKVQEEKRPRYDPGNYLGPGNLRANGERNPDYSSTYVFTNDFGALLQDTPGLETIQQKSHLIEGTYEKGGLLKATSERGICRVVCFSPRFDLTLAEMEVEDIVKVIEMWQKEYQELGSKDFINYVQVFF